MPIILLIILSFLFLNVQAQHPCPKYDIAIKEGNKELEKKRYSKALDQFQDAQTAARGCNNVTDTPALRIKEVFKAIEGERKRADSASKVARTAQIATAKEAEKTRAALGKTDIANKKANSLIKSFYYYDDRFAVAFRRNTNKFYFINNEGFKVDKFDEWDAAEQFDSWGFARVKRGSQPYLLDTLGNVYKCQNKDIVSGFIEVVDVQDRALKNFPDSLIKKTTRIINVANNDIDKFPEKLKDHKKLLTLILSDNDLDSITGDIIGSIDSLKILDLSDNQLTGIPKEIGSLKNLVSLNISHNAVQNLPIEIEKLSSLQELDISGNDFKSIAPDLSNLPALKILDLSGNHLTGLPEGFDKLYSLERLMFKNNFLSTFSASEKLKNLKVLDLSVNKLTTFPSTIANLITLTEIDLSGNKFKEIPEQIGNLKNLEYLALNQDSIKKIPNQIGNLKKLLSLNLSNNSLTVIPNDFGNLVNVTQVNLNANRLDSLPENFVNLKSLEELDLTNNRLKNLPKQFGKLQTLISLKLGHNQISELPDDICDLTNLEYLDLRDNISLRKLPENIGNLTKLNSLYLYKTNISKEEKERIKKLLPNCKNCKF